MLPGAAQVALRHGELPVQLSDSAVRPVRWVVEGGLGAMGQERFSQCMALLFEGGAPGCRLPAHAAGPSRLLSWVGRASRLCWIIALHSH
jgi:hypothetical protein